MTLKLPLLYVLWLEEYCQISPNKNQITKPLTCNQHLSLLYFSIKGWVKHSGKKLPENYKVDKVIVKNSFQTQAYQSTVNIMISLLKDFSNKFFWLINLKFQDIVRKPQILKLRKESSGGFFNFLWSFHKTCTYSLFNAIFSNWIT